MSVLLEPLLMAAAALLIGLVSSMWSETINWDRHWLQVAGLVAILIGIQPRILNILLHRLSRSKNQADATAAEAIELTNYPLIPFWEKWALSFCAESALC